MSGPVRPAPKCPTCDRSAPHENNAWFPFCSERCRLVDLGQWLTEQYRVPVKEPDDSPKETATSNLPARPKGNGADDR